MLESVKVQQESSLAQPNIFTKILNYKVGVIPLPVYLVLAVVIIGAAFKGKLPNDMIGGFAAMMILGIVLGDLGFKIPVLKNIGGPAILAIFVPSAMMAYKMLHPDMIKTITTLMKTSNFLYLYISCLVAGSILGMNRRILIQGFLRMFVPLIVGTLASVAIGCTVGMLMGYGFAHTFFYIVIPIVGGGVGEGILPLSIAYSEILGKPQPDFVALCIPAALLGNVVAIVTCGWLKRFGDKHPEYSGKGLLVRSGDDQALLEEQNKQSEKPVEFPLMGAGLLIACSFFIFGGLASVYIGIPGPIIMIFTAALVKVFNIMPARMEQGAYHMYRFISGSLTYPLLVGIGLIYVPWNDLIRAFTPAYIITCIATVLAMISSGFFIGKFLGMYQVESAIVTGCHSGLGGTGDVAILSASDRMVLMPFAQISTRVGGASMIVLATILMKIFHVLP